MKKLIVLFIFVAIISTVFAQSPDILWTKTYGGAGKDKANSVKQTPDGGFIIIGYTESMGVGGYLIKTDQVGNVEWTQYYPELNGDMKKDIQLTNDGGYIISGDGDMSIHLLKIDSEGNQQWEQTFGEINGDFKTSVKQTSDGGYIFTSFTFQGMNIQFYIVKLDENGQEEWNWLGNGLNSDMDIGADIIQTTDGGYIACGFTAPSLMDAYVVRLDANGNLLWAQSYGGNMDDAAFSITPTEDNCYVIAGLTNSFGEGQQDFYLFKIDDNGNELWSKTYGGDAEDEAYSVKQTPDGGFIITGETYSFDAQWRDIYVVKTDPEGNMLWDKLIGGQDIETGWDIEVLNDGNYIIAGMTKSFGAGDIDYYLVKLASYVSSFGQTVVNNNSYIKNIYPNPFNPFANISFYVQNENANTTISIYNLKGKHITTLLDKKMPRGNNSISWNGKDKKGKQVASGIYFAVLKNGLYKTSQKMILLK